MSQLYGAALPQNIITRNDLRATDDFYFGREDLVQPQPLLNLDNQDSDWAGNWTTPWWPAHGTIMNGWDGVPENTLLQTNPWWATPWDDSGSCNGRLGFVGYTRDAYGSVLGGCTVRCFRASTNELMSMVVSDANGFYIATTPYYESHYLVVHPADPLLGAGATTANQLPA